jgi:hypothetical protein
VTGFVTGLVNGAAFMSPGMAGWAIVVLGPETFCSQTISPVLVLSGTKRTFVSLLAVFIPITYIISGSP